MCAHTHAIPEPTVELKYILNVLMNLGRQAPIKMQKFLRVIFSLIIQGIKKSELIRINKAITEDRNQWNV